MKVLIVGAAGNMGRRYSAIVRALGHEVLPVDIVLPDAPMPTDWDHAIVATPTDAHVNTLFDLLKQRTFDQPPLHILCEKPIAKTTRTLEPIYMAMELDDSNLYVVNQYAHLFEAPQFRYRFGFRSSWNYYNSGRDGLKWDCFQMFALANGELSLSKESPIWTCVINGVWINLKHMDHAYVSMIQDFLGPKKNVWGRDIVLKTTERILAYQ